MGAEVRTSDRFPPAAASLVFARLLNRHSPHEIACAIEVLIDLHNIMDGDPDAETEALEDDFTLIPAGVDFGPGCPLADPCGQATEDEISAYPLKGYGPGCPISDPDDDREGDK